MTQEEYLILGLVILATILVLVILICLFFLIRWACCPVCGNRWCRRCCPSFYEDDDDENVPLHRRRPRLLTESEEAFIRMPISYSVPEVYVNELKTQHTTPSPMRTNQNNDRDLTRQTMTIIPLEEKFDRLKSTRTPESDYEYLKGTPGGVAENGVEKSIHSKKRHMYFGREMLGNRSSNPKFNGSSATSASKDAMTQFPRVYSKKSNLGRSQQQSKLDDGMGDGYHLSR